MDLKNKRYKNTITNEEFVVDSQFDNIVMIKSSNGTPIKIEENTLLDDNVFVEVSNFNTNTQTNDAARDVFLKNIDTSDKGVINEQASYKNRSDVLDPDAFFKSTGVRQIAEQIEHKINNGAYDNTLPMKEERASYINPIDGIVEVISLEDEKKELMKKYANEFSGKTPQHITEDNTKEEEDVIVIDRDKQQPQIEDIKPIQSNMNNGNTIPDMFKHVKRTLDFTATMNIEDKIPRIDFIKMWEESYDVSIIDYLTDDITSKLLSNPSDIKNLVHNTIETMVYGNIKKPKAVKPKKAVKKEPKTSKETENIE